MTHSNGLVGSVEEGSRGSNSPEPNKRATAVLAWLGSRGGDRVTAGKIANILSSGASAHEYRLAAFEVIRRLPFRFARFNPNSPDDLFTFGYGDGRHKAAALNRLMHVVNDPSRVVTIPFNWRDLPIPVTVLTPLSETRGFHDSVEMLINGEYHLVDATWDPVFAKVGFPVLPSWNGLTATPSITRAGATILRPGTFKSRVELYERFGFGSPERPKTLAFYRAFNAWAAKVRADSRGSQ